MLTLLRWLSLRHWLGHPVRTLLTVLGVSLGVAVGLSVRLISGEILQSHRRSLEHIAGKAELTVRAGDAGMERELADRIAEVDGVGPVDPVLEKVLLEPDRGPLLLLGIDFLGDDALRNLEAVEGDEEVIEDPISFLNSTEAVVVPRSFGESRGLAKGDEFELITPAGRRTFRIEGMLEDKGAVKAFGGDVVVMFLDAAQVALDLGYTITHVDLATDGTVTPADLKVRLQAALSEEYDVEYPGTRGARLEQMMEGFQQALTLMSALAIWVGVLLAYNAVEISVRQRQKEIAILRALGAPTRGVMGQILLEAAAIGVLASLTGITLGTGLARAGLEQTAGTVSEVFAVVKVEEIQLTMVDVVGAILVGMVMPVVAAWWPALEVARLPPYLGLSRPVAQGSNPRKERRSLIVGLLLAGVGFVVFLLPAAQRRVDLGQGAFALVLFGALFFAPALVVGMAHLLQRSLGGRLSAEAVVATDHVVRDRQRAALNVASLVAGVATVITIATYIHSIKYTYDGWIESTAPADVFITAGASFGVSKTSPSTLRSGTASRRCPKWRGCSGCGSATPTTWGGPSRSSAWN